MKKHQQNRHSLLAKGIMVLLALLVLVFAFAYSWFADKPKVTATGISGGTECDGDFEYAIGFQTSQTFGEYAMTAFTNESTALHFDSLQAKTPSDSTYSEYNLLHDYTPIDVTGSGATLIRPAMSYGNSQINTDVNDYSLADPNVQYINFDLFFRSQTPDVDIKLGDGSYAVGACEIKGNGKNDVGNGAMTSTSTAGTYGFNESGYGSFSKDAIVGAVRIAFVPYTFANASTGTAGIDNTNLYTDTTQYLASASSLLWLPRPDLKVVPNVVSGDEQTTGWTLNTSATNATYTLDGFSGTFHNNKHTYYRIFENPSVHNVGEYADTVTPAVLADSDSDNTFTTIGRQVKIGDYYYTKVNVRIWVEGTDPESRRALSGGRFAVNFKFRAG